MNEVPVHCRKHIFTSYEGNVSNEYIFGSSEGVNVKEL
jgi:hypothetical protein